MHRRQLAIFSVAALLVFSLINSLAVHQITDQERLDYPQKIVFQIPRPTPNHLAGQIPQRFWTDDVYDVHVDIEGFTYLLDLIPTGWDSMNKSMALLLKVH